LEWKMMKDGAGTEWNQLIQNWRFWDDVSSEKIGFWPAKHGQRTSSKMTQAQQCSRTVSYERGVI
jgi:hypothetical protein